MPRLSKSVSESWERVVQLVRPDARQGSMYCGKPRATKPCSIVVGDRAVFPVSGKRGEVFGSLICVVLVWSLGGSRRVEVEVVVGVVVLNVVSRAPV